MDTKAAYQKKMQAQLDEWNAKIAALQARADKKAAEGEIEVYRNLDHLKAKRDEMTAKLKELEAAGEGSWESLKTSVAAAAEKFKTKLDDLFARG
jgi:uncharacterized coiled-coil DUF342 family protein